MNRIPAIIAAAALYAAAAVQLTGNAQAYDILDMATPPPAPSSPSSGTALSGGSAASSAFGTPRSLRVEGGFGYNNGGTDTTVSSRGIGSVSTNLLGGSGLAAEAAIWSDSPIMALPGISLGAQYLYFGDSGSVTATSGVGPILGLTSATANLNLTTHAVMFDAAWRPRVQSIHPFLGTGVGVAFTTLSGSALGFSASNSQAAVAGQVFLGVDMDLTPNMYVGVTGRFFISEATYHAPGVGVANNIDITNRPISLMAHLGVQF